MSDELLYDLRGKAGREQAVTRIEYVPNMDNHTNQRQVSRLYYCRDYYDANRVAQESYNTLYSEKEPETRCDCGSVTERGCVYCNDCLDNGDAVMRKAIDEIMRYNNCTEDQAEQFACYWLENTAEFQERRNIEFNADAK